MLNFFTSFQQLNPPIDLNALISQGGTLLALATSAYAIWRAMRQERRDQESAQINQAKGLSEAESSFREDIIERLSRVEKENELLRAAREEDQRIYETTQLAWAYTKGQLEEQIAALKQRLTTIILQRDSLQAEVETLKVQIRQLQSKE